MTTSERFIGEKAPCGRTADGEHVRDSDDEGLVIDHLYFGCGCRKSRHEFHDGSIQMRIYNHHGKLVNDEHSSMHEA